eukprot:CCRYP_017841-RA/>CCRYP_017841-RA protein AED:0.45 eAED:0.45 QI:116/1/0.5/1/0/0/2/0/33
MATCLPRSSSSGKTSPRGASVDLSNSSIIPLTT